MCHCLLTTCNDKVWKTQSTFRNNNSKIKKKCKTIYKCGVGKDCWEWCRFRTHDLKSRFHWSVSILLTDEQDKSKYTTKIILFFNIRRGRFIMEQPIRVLSQKNSNWTNRPSTVQIYDHCHGAQLRLYDHSVRHPPGLYKRPWWKVSPLNNSPLHTCTLPSPILT